MSTFFGGDGSEGCEALCTDSDGEIFISGYTGSFEFPVTSGAYNTNWAYDVCFVSKLQGNPAVSSLQNIKNEELKIYPNPSNGVFNIENRLNENMQITILSTSGQELLNTNAMSSKTIDLTSFNAGVYFVRIRTNDANYCNKIIID
jgi:hypothetical protein